MSRDPLLSRRFKKTGGVTVYQGLIGRHCLQTHLCPLLAYQAPQLQPAEKMKGKKHSIKISTFMIYS